MTLVHVWSNAPDVGVMACADARLHGRHGRQVLYGDRFRGQAGWHVGLMFASIESLAQQLVQLRLPQFVTNPRAYDSTREGRRMRSGELFKLAINAHGTPGRAYVAGMSSPRRSLATGDLEALAAPLRTIGSVLHRSALVYFMGCNVAAGNGRELLNELSGTYWRGRFVIGFTGVGYTASGGMTRSGEMCTEPGMRDSGHNTTSSGQDRTGAHPDWTNLRRLPWATEKSPGAVVSCLGRVIHSPEEPNRGALPTLRL